MARVRPAVPEAARNDETRTGVLRDMAYAFVDAGYVYGGPMSDESGAGTSRIQTHQSARTAYSVAGAEGWNDITPPSSANLQATIDSLTSSCLAQTNSLPQSERNTNPAAAPAGTGSVWAGGCNPLGMILTLNAIPNPPGVNLHAPEWVAWTWDASSKTAALNAVYNSILEYGSPALIPIYGVSDHWITIVDVRTTTTNNVTSVTHVRWVDSGPQDGVTTDGQGNTYNNSGITTPQVLGSMYYQVLTDINDVCDASPTGCSQDPYYNQFVLMFEPPHGDLRYLNPVAFTKHPGIASTMNEALARRFAWDAITSAGVDTEADVKDMMNSGTAHAAFLVNAVFPDGSPWNYYLVPVLSKADRRLVIGFVQLEAADGSFQSVNFLPQATQLSFTTKEKARKLARNLLAPGEHLARGGLTFDPLASTKIRRSATLPYYEFQAVGSAGKPTAVIRVSLSDGGTERTP